MKQKIYLEDVPLDEALSAFEVALRAAGLWDALPSELTPVAGARGRVTAEPVWAEISSPHYNASAMDGFALRSRDTIGATETTPLQFSLLESGNQPSGQTRPALVVDTGQPIPDWADTVVMVEHTHRLTDASGLEGIEIRAALAPWRNVRLMGEDMVATELVLPANHRLRPVDLGAIAGSGHEFVSVYQKPRVAIIPTGSELVEVGQIGERGIAPGNILEYNSIVLAAQIEQWGGFPVRWPIVADDFDAIKDAVLKAAREFDLILVNAGSSAGTKDYTADIVESLGQLLVHGVAVRPGHPVILGIIGGQGDKAADGIGTRIVPIIGVPGYPVSTALTGEIFVEPLLARWQGLPKHQPSGLQAIVTRKVMSHTGDDDFVRVSVGMVRDRYMATPISRGAGVITSLVRADGILRIPRFSEGVDAGSLVEVHLYRSRNEIDKTIVAIGSHDLTLDLLSQFLSSRNRGQRLSSANVGSLGGLIALSRGEAHIAGSHLLDPDSGEYNSSYVERYLPNEDIVLVSFVEREQGWIVPKGNPKKLRSWDDVARPDIQIMNRQRGAGTRVLLDFEMKKRGFESAEVRGYDEAAYNHLAVAAAVATSMVDTGLGIAAAARALDLDFVPLANEQYDLVMSREVYESELLHPLLDLLSDPEFIADAAAMPGYKVDHMGEMRMVSS